MKNYTKLLLVIFSFLNITNSIACDFCGSATNGGSLGLLNYSNNSFLGARYIYQSYKTNDGMYANSPWQNENYATYQIWSKIKLSDRLFVSAIIPFHNHNRELQNSNLKLKGIGDLTILGGYQLLNATNHEIQFTVGVKVPTGKYASDANGSINPGFQLGTGSVDYLAALEYRLHLSDFVWINSVNYNFKTENSDKYKFGNQTNLTSSLGYKIKSNVFEMLPSVGIAHEDYDTNKFYGRDVIDTKGNITFLKIAADVSFKDFTLGVQYQSPLHQDLNNGLVKNTSRSGIYFNYNF